MELSSIIIGAFIVALCVMPFVIMGVSQKNKNKKKLSTLTTLAKNNGCLINQHQIIGNLIVGIDYSKPMFFLHKNINNQVFEQCINLSGIKACKVDKTSKTVGNSIIIDKLELVFYNVDKNMPKAVSEFYNSQVSIQFYDELKAIEKWADIINKTINLQ